MSILFLKKKVLGFAAVFFMSFLIINTALGAVFNNDPQDYPTLRVMNFTQQGTANTQWAASTTGSPGDVISFAIYYHNTSNEVASDVRLIMSPQTTSVGTNHAFTASVRANNASAIWGNASVSISGPQSMFFVPGSVVWRPNQNISGSQTLPYGQSGGEIFTSSGLRLGDIAPGWSTQGSLVLHFKIQETQILAPTVSLSANPSSIAQGSSAALYWNSTNAASCFASGGWSGARSLSGSEQVSPLVTTTYSLNCTNTNGQSDTKSATVSVNQPVQESLPTVSITANLISVLQGQSIVLTWTSSNATSCYATLSWWGTKPLLGSETVAPVNVYGGNIFRITCSNSAGSRSAEVNVSVNQVQNLSVSLTASQTSVNAGSPVTLFWTSSNANTCFVSNGWSGTRAFSGNEIVYPQTTATHAITCLGSNNQQRTESITITVTQPQVVPTVSITANPAQIYSGGSSALVWNSNNANSCYATGAWTGSKSTSGLQTVYPSVASTYTIVCTESAGLQAQSSVTVSVIPTVAPPPPAQIFNAACVPDISVARSGQQVEFFAGSSDGARPLLYNWSGAVSGASESVGAVFSTTGTKTAYLTITDATGRKANTTCSVKVIAAVVMSSASKPGTPPPPAGGQPPCTYYCVPVIMQGNTMYPVFGGLPPQGYQYPQQQPGQTPQWRVSPPTGWQNPPTPAPDPDSGSDAVKKNDRSIMASVFLTEDGSPRTGILFLIYLFLLSLSALVIFAIYSMAVRLRRPTL